MMLSAGKLRHRVDIERATQIQDSSGAMEDFWEVVATVWCEIAPMSAKEFIAAQTEVSKITTRVIIRYRDDIDPSCRLYHSAKAQYYNVEGVLADKESGLEYLTLMCSEGVRYA